MTIPGVGESDPDSIFLIACKYPCSFEVMLTYSHLSSLDLPFAFWCSLSCLPHHLMSWPYFGWIQRFVWMSLTTVASWFLNSCDFCFCSSSAIHFFEHILDLISLGTILLGNTSPLPKTFHSKPPYSFTPNTFTLYCGSQPRLYRRISWGESFFEKSGYKAVYPLLPCVEYQVSTAS